MDWKSTSLQCTKKNGRNKYSLLKCTIIDGMVGYGNYYFTADNTVRVIKMKNETIRFNDIMT